MPPDPANPEINLRFREGEMQVLELAALANITWQPGPGFDNPVLLLAGGEDVVVPPANQLKLVSSVPGETCWLMLWCVPRTASSRWVCTRACGSARLLFVSDKPLGCMCDSEL